MPQLNFEPDKSWSLFLDRDGVINERLMGDYVKRVEEFRFIPGTKQAIKHFRNVFGKIFVVTNQQGIGKGLMTKEDLKKVHDYMLKELNAIGVEIDQVYYCPELAADNAPCRKPNTGMAEQAKKDFPAVDFSKSLMVGDSPSDIEMGKRLNMKTVFIGNEEDSGEADYCLESLEDLASWLS